MRSRWLAVMLAIAGGARAAPAPAAPATWADWVGDWHGKLKWTSCASEGAGATTLAVDATDGAVAIDLASIAPGLTEMSLVEDNARWLGQRGDVNVKLER